MTDYLITNDPIDIGGGFTDVAGRFDADFADHAIIVYDDTYHPVDLPGVHDIWIALMRTIGSR